MAIRPNQRARLMTLELHGPFFSADPVKTYRMNIRAFQDKWAAQAAEEVRSRLRTSREASSAGKYIHGRTSSLGGRRWATYAVVSSTDKSLDGATQRWVNALLSGRRVSTVTRSYTPGGAARMGRNIGTTRGADGRKAFAATARVFRKLLKDTDFMVGM